MKFAARLFNCFFQIIPCLFLFTCPIQVQAQNIRKKIPFDAGWKFHFGNAADPAKDFNYGIANLFSKTGKAENTCINPKFKDSAWHNVQLPHDWAVELPFVQSANADVVAHGYKPVGGLFPETSIGWYRKTFRLAAVDSGQRFSLQFDGIFRNSSVWVNGIYAGNNQSGYLGMNYDITDFLNFRSVNVIVVRVDATQYEGWFYEGAGIYRHVWLNQSSKLHLADDGLFVSTLMQPGKTLVNVQAEIENNGLNATGSTLQSYILNRNGQRIATGIEQPVPTLEPLARQAVRQQVSVTNPHLWSVDDPYLYRLVTLVRQGGKIVDSTNTRFGIRTIEMNALNGLLLNGKPLKIKGTNNHQDHAGVGSALPDYLQYYRIRLLKEMGCNAIRTSHNAPTPELLDACDSLGMLVLDETRLLNSGTEYLSQLERLIKRDRNHPAIFIWSIGNEEGYIQTNSTGRRIAQTMLAKQKQLDPTRTSTYAADVANIFSGVNEVIPVRGFNYRVAGVVPYHKDHLNQPIIGTEMGSTVTTRGIYVRDSVRAYVPDQDITAPWWANRAEEWWPLCADNQWWMGGFVWTGFDYRGEPTPYEWPNINSHFGLMDVCGFPKNIYYYYQSWWTDKDVLHISPHWNLPAGQLGLKGKIGDRVDVWVNSNADNVELFLNGKSLGKKDMPRNKHLQWSVAYEPGKLEAVAYKKGRKITAAVETTGAPAEVVITPYKTTMLADGQDATVINVSVTDRQGREVPDAANLIRFRVKGNAKIIGVGNGDPSSHEADKCADSSWQRSAFNGKCQLIVQAGTSPDLIKVEAISDSLWTGSTDIQTVYNGTVRRVAGKSTNKPTAQKQIGKMLGADISFLPELEGRGIQFSDNGVAKDAIQILKEHGLNYIRLRIFNNPATDSGYSPGKGFCDLAHTLQMAKRIKAAGMKFLLDFHYSDYWADPGKQFKPAAWKNMPFPKLKDSVTAFTKQVLLALKAQGTLPDMVQPGNEINHGMLWPDGNIKHLDSLAQLIRAGIDGINAVDPDIVIMLHIALGGQTDESQFFIDNMLARGVDFDVIGESYYPKWHGILADLRSNLNTLAAKYGKDVVVVEYSQLKNEVNEIGFNVINGHGKGSFIWEPLSTWEQFFDRNGKSNDLLKLYDEFHSKYLLTGVEKAIQNKVE